MALETTLERGKPHAELEQLVKDWKKDVVEQGYDIDFQYSDREAGLRVFLMYAKDDNIVLLTKNYAGVKADSGLASVGRATGKLNDLKSVGWLWNRYQGYKRDMSLLDENAQANAAAKAKNPNQQQG